MAGENIRLINVNPDEVVFALEKATFAYPANAETEQYVGWSNVAVMVELFKLTARLGRFPLPDEGFAYIMDLCEERWRWDDRVRNRGRKLYLDFCREMHTFGLLQAARNTFAWSEYEGSKDIGFNVDYTAGLLSRLVQAWSLSASNVGIQSMMRKDKVDVWDAVKQKRRAGRGQLEWDGPRFWITNQHRAPYRAPARCWLFTSKHIRDLADDIRGTLGHETNLGIGIQAKFEF
jgi:hypothetical protein